MAQLDAREVYTELVRLGHDTNPEKQGYKSRVAGKTVLLYDLNGQPCELRAENIEGYVAKGFTFALGNTVSGLPKRTRKPKGEPAAEAPTETPEGESQEDSNG